ncbi:hypothetical protein SRABI98_00738 [Microbacterium sp. Bi98]|uniref:ThuA domain-containing protein n=1 Tax=Microbacterium sp. Bi98 TaxID=2821116 RepID=UPI001E18D5EC|nr:ThuA domain-containing protein [Microbacterium sp. Bi98]CAH0149010.1 hypothetical protein SRABI98_00738 [Microbacterium sp. Bi98]
MLNAHGTRQAMLASADGRYTDPWHPFTDTTDCLRRVLQRIGFEVTVAPVDEAMQHLQDIDLLVVNAGDPWRHDAPPATGVSAASISGIESALRGGIGVLAMHTSLSSLRDYPAWAPATGRIWLPGISMHPPISETQLSWSKHPLAGTETLSVFDERYAYLQAIGDSEIVAEHEHDGVQHPLVWVREHLGSRIAVDLLGHDTRSYESESHLALIERLANWVTR